MATDDADAAPRQLEGDVADQGRDEAVAVAGEYTWDDFLRAHGHADAADRLYERFDAAPGSDRWGEDETERTLTPEDWDRAGVDPADFLGFPPWEFEDRIGAAHRVAEQVTAQSPLVGYDETPVIKDIYGWADYKREYYYDEEGDPPTGEEGEVEPFDPADALGFDPEALGEVMADGERTAEDLLDLEDERTVDIQEDLDEDAFFSTVDGTTTVANRYDLEKTVPQVKKSHFREIERYWVNKPYAFVVIFHSTKENEKKYYVVQPHLNEIEDDLTEYLTDKLRTAIKYDDEGTAVGDEEHRRSVIEERTYDLLERYDLYERPQEGRESWANKLAETLDIDPDGAGGKLLRAIGYEDAGPEGPRKLAGIAARPEPAVIADDETDLTEYQVEKLLYYLERDFIGYERIDGIKHDINVEDISCDGYNSPVFVYHSDYEQIITNIYHDEKELDDFVVKLAQRSGKGISKRRPQVDATLPDGSRAQLTLGNEVSDHGTNYTIRQFKDVPFTPVDLINWRTFSLDEMAYLWLCIENHKSLIFAGGTASGKTTSLNAVSLFIPSNSKIVSIEDTREVELPQRNWVASVTRPSFSDDDKGDIDEFDLLEAALRQRPDYIVMGEVRGEEGRTLFQVMSTGHTTYTTFHADNVGEVLKRFTTEPINVSKTMFTALDLVSIQTATRVQGDKVRRNKSLTEINHYDAENDEINVQDVYQWQAETDEFLRMGESNTLEDIMFDRGWSREKLDDEMFKRQVVLAFLIDRGLNTYTQVAATFQAFINDPETILSLMANELLEESLEDLREMESVLIDIDSEKEEMVPRPDPSEEILAECRELLDRAEDELFAQYVGETPDSVADALSDVETQPDVQASPNEAETGSALPEGSPEDGESDRSTLDESDEEELALDSGEAVPEVDDEHAPPALDAGSESGGSGDSPEPEEDATGTQSGAEAAAAGDAAQADQADGTTGADQAGETSEADDTEPEPTGSDGDEEGANEPAVPAEQWEDDADEDWADVAREPEADDDESSGYDGDGDDEEVDIDEWGFGEVENDDAESSRRTDEGTGEE